MIIKVLIADRGWTRIECYSTLTRMGVPVSMN
jgi:hypothetical protein